MRILEWLFGASSSEPRQESWREHGRDALPAAAGLFLKELARQAGIEDPQVATGEDRFAGELRGTLGGHPLRAVVTTFGSVELELLHEEELDFMDLEYDPEREAAPEPALPPWGDEKRPPVVGPGVCVSDSGKELAAFRALPTELQEQLVNDLRQHRIRYFRSRPERLEVTFWDNLHEMRDAEATVTRALALGLEVLAAREASPPGASDHAPFNAQVPFRGWGGLSEDERWARALSFGRVLVEQIPGARLVERRDDDAVEVRWKEGTCAVRMALGVLFGTLEVAARAPGVEACFDLLHDPEVTPDDATPADEWDTPDRFVFFARNTYVQGTEALTRREAAVLHALPAQLRDALVQIVESAPLGRVSLDEGVLEASAGELVNLRDGGQKARELARLLARVAEALPRGAAPRPTSDTPVRCADCHGFWFRGPERAPCRHCGTPYRG
ncbi:hypothetical protein [Corallococcus sicarius]|uniref:Uncharacterized protein n=1 Tax=Corallococcus sicarius TaxID=2316726 RepID=A0A3A8N409_9BACT|nr:hypothetical protein [Corallococcus sicarius]RKH33974.1 hypothetical protein D7X12_35525 [Corallococcus sicarius]